MKRFMLSLFMLLAFSGAACAAVDLNTATREELISVKGIGPVKAQAIIEYRNEHGPFRKVDDLKAVKGFGDKSVNNLRHEVSVTGDPARKAEKK